MREVEEDFGTIEGISYSYGQYCFDYAERLKIVDRAVRRRLLYAAFYGQGSRVGGIY